MPRLTHRFRARVLAGVVTAALAAVLPVAGAAPASAHPSPHPHRTLTYAALGDSYAAGQATDCRRTRSSYPMVLDRKRGIRLVQDLACAGATSTTVRTTQVPALRHRVRLITITAGGNDLDLPGLVQACQGAPAGTACRQAIAVREAALPALGRSLTATFVAARRAAPHARILVTAYAPLVAAGPILTATEALNATIRAATVAASRPYARIRYVDVRFTGHTIESPHPWFFVSGPNALHPNPAGQRAYARAIAAAIPRSS